MANYDIDEIVRNHQRNFDILAGRRGNKYTNYEWIITKDDLVGSYLKSMADLGYPLRKEVKRDRYVLNKEALEKAIEKTIEETMKQFEKEFNQWFAYGVMPMMEEGIQEVLDEINVVNNNLVVKHSPNKIVKTTSMSSKFADRLAQALVKSIFDILDDTVFPKGKY